MKLTFVKLRACEIKVKNFVNKVPLLFSPLIEILLKNEKLNPQKRLSFFFLFKKKCREDLVEKDLELHLIIKLVFNLLF